MKSSEAKPSNNTTVMSDKEQSRDTMNVLVLGRTGSGKSTLINTNLMIKLR